MKKIFLTMLTGTALFTQLAAQEAEEKHSCSGQSGCCSSSQSSLSIGIGYLSMDLGNTNAHLRSLNLPEMKEDGLLAVNATASYYANPRLFSDITGTVATYKNEDNSTKLQQTIGLLDVNVNYKLFNSERASLSPALGVGWQSNTMKFNKFPTNSNFQQTLAGFTGERTYQAMNLYYLNLRLAFDVKLSMEHNISLGLHGGYRVGLNEETWELTNTQLSGSPRFDASGYNVGLVLTAGMGK